MPSRDDLIRDRDDLISRAEAILDAAQHDGRDLTDTERTDHDGLLERIEATNALIVRADTVERIRRVAANPANRHSGSEPDSRAGAAFASAGRSAHGWHSRADLLHGRRDPWADRPPPQMENDADLRSRALTAIEVAPTAPDADRQRMTMLIEADRSGELAEHVLAVADPAYRTAFVSLLRNPHADRSWDDQQREAWARVEQTRTAMSLTAANGGYMLPFELDPSIILSNAGTSNQLRKIARVIPTTQNVWHGVSSAGVTAEWTAEGAEAADASPTLLQPTVTCYKGDAYVQASYEFLADSNIESELGALIADAKDRLEATAFTVGNGTTQPHGLLTVLSGTTASRVASTTNGSYGALDVYALDNALSPRWRANASWLANRSIYNVTRQFATGSGPQSAFWADFGGGLPAGLIGYPTFQASDMTASLSAATASNDDIMILGDFRQYAIVDRIGVSLIFEPLVKGANFRPTGSVGWYATWRVGGDVLVPDAFRLLRV